jgi:Glycosyl hydrolase-like 10
MLGHGSPNLSSQIIFTALRNKAARWRKNCARAPLLALLVFAPFYLHAEELRLRVAWGGGRERQWQGTVTISEGRLAEPNPLGIEADEPASMYLESGGANSRQRLIIRQRSSRAYDGFDVLADAPLSARCTIQLTAADAPDRPVTVEIPLSDVVEEFVNKDLDGQGNRILVTRAPGDQVRVDFTRDSLIFSPGETFRFNARPHLLPLPEGTKIRLKVQLLGAAGGKEIWSSQHEVQIGRESAIPIELPLPEDEGSYEVLLSVSYNAGWPQAVRRPLVRNKTVAERKIELLVLDPQRPPPAARSDREFTQQVEIDPANPRWWELPKLTQLQLPKTWRLWKGSLGNGNSKPYRHSLGNLVQLNPNADSPDVSWEAYWVPISQPGRPHILEVDYPSDVPQTLGISVLEPNAAGTLAAIGLDSGVDLQAEIIAEADAPRMLRHRLIFWPRTGTPLVLLTNGRDHSPAVYGKIRVLAGGEQLPRAVALPQQQSQRLIAAYLDRPLFPENFSAAEAYDEWCGRSLDNWNTFYEGGTRLISYLQHVGYNGLMLGVLADGSTIYPSALTDPSPRYDTGVFFTSAQDPVRKDVLEMLMRMFDREGMQLIPSLEFAAPLPELEAVRRGGGPEAETIDWIGPEGVPYNTVHPAKRGLAPYYNVLNPRVQNAMLAVLAEVVDRYARHPSFSGLAIRLSADGYAQLPGPDWGLDDRTIAAFERDAKVSVPGDGPDRFAARAAFFAQEPNRRLWIEWRADRLSEFYLKAQKLLLAARPDNRLYLAGAEITGGEDGQTDLKPALSRHTTMAELYMNAGIETKSFQANRQLVFLRPERLSPGGNLAAMAADLEIGQMPDAERYFQGLPVAGSLFFHKPREIHIPSFDQKSPIKSSYSGMVLQPSPSGAQNRRRFVHDLAALDTQAMFDGGWLLPMGQEDAIRGMVAAYRALPAVPFRQVSDQQTPSQPVTFRTGTYSNRTYLYAINDAPFRVTARLHVETKSACRLEELTGLRKVPQLKSDSGGGMYWEIQLEPYDLVAAQLSEANIQFSRPQVTLPKSIEPALGRQIGMLGVRAAALRNPPPLDVLENPDFEKSSDARKGIPGWSITTRDGVSVQLDSGTAHGGKQSAHIVSNGPVACLVSRPLPAPTTGRVSMSVWLRIADPDKQPPLRLALQGIINGSDKYSFAPVGCLPGGKPAGVNLSNQWAQYIFQVDDLPLEGMTSLQARFDLMGPGEVWVDDVKLCNLAFSLPEIIELSKLITLADTKLRNGQVYDCMHLLEGYWPRFLDENVRLPVENTIPSKPAAGLADQPATTPSAEEPPTQNSDRTGWLNRMKNLLPEKLRY